MTFKISQSLTSQAKRFAITSLAVPAMLLLCEGRADAILNYYIFEDGSNLKVATTGSLTLTNVTPPPQEGSLCTMPPPGGYIWPFQALICSGVEDAGDKYKKYTLNGPDFFDYQDPSNNMSYVGPANHTTGVSNWLWAKDNLSSIPRFYIIDTYIDGTPIDSSATFNGQNLASVGLGSTPSGTNIGSWTFVGDTNPNNRINVFVGDPPNAPVPAPLPLIGAAGAYGWSRRLRRRIGSAGNR